MRKLSLLVSLFCALGSAQAQCTPDPFALLPLNPTPADTLLGYVNVPFSQTITIKVPQDTTVTLPPPLPSGPYTLNIIKQQLMGIDGMPSGFNYVCNNWGCTWGGGDVGCWNISGTPTQAGVYSLACNISTTIQDPAPGISLPNTPVPVSYVLKVSDANAIEGALQANVFGFANCKPTPASDMTTLRFSYPVPGTLTLTLLDMAGRTLRTEHLSCNAGINELPWDIRNVQPGIYLLNLTDGKKMLQQKLVVQ